MAGLFKKAFSWMRAQSDLTHSSIVAGVTAASLPALPLLSPTTLVALNLSSMSVQFGTQVYVAFVGGPTMFVNLPKVVFGDVQARLFPKMGMLCMSTGALTLASYSVAHPVDTASYFLSTSLAVNVLNTFIIFPLVTQYMMELREHKDDSPERKKAAMKFGVTHGLSNLINLASMLANLGYIYLIASRVVNNW